ncbi:MAG: MATE family efflux transporter [Oscillospiraceae bacterium]|nr:MATE family efflux transporter [Oscillospiraceae bacterium]
MDLRRLIGDRAFYRKLFSVLVPILIQNLITNFVSLLDNIMVGQVGTEPMSGVAIVNQLLFVFNLCIFGGLAGAGIFTAQFCGKGDDEGVRYTFRAKLFIALGAVTVFALLLIGKGETLIRLFLHEGRESLDLEATLRFGRSYLRVMLLQMLPFALCQVYAGTLRETGETMLPMKAGIIAVFVNLTFNYILIFGKLGFPAMGVVGAAVATVIARLVECSIVVLWTHCRCERCRFIVGAYRSLHVPGQLARRMLRLGAPLLANEVLWAGGMTVLNQCYSLRGLEVISALNISTTITNLFLCAFFAMGNAISILIGQLLGAGETARAVDEDRKLIAFALTLSVFIGSVMACVAPLIPQIYNTTSAVKALACSLLYVSAAAMPMNAYTNACYFTLRSGGKTIVTFIFDSAFLWCVAVPTAFVLSRFTALPILPLYIAVYALDLIKCVIGTCLLRRRKWVNNIVSFES